MFNNVSLEFSVLMPRLIKLDQMVISVKIKFNFQKSYAWRGFWSLDPKAGIEKLMF